MTSQGTATVLLATLGILTAAAVLVAAVPERSGDRNTTTRRRQGRLTMDVIEEGRPREVIGGTRRRAGAPRTSLLRAP